MVRKMTLISEELRLKNLPRICYLKLGNQVCYSKGNESAIQEP